MWVEVDVPDTYSSSLNVAIATGGVALDFGSAVATVLLALPLRRDTTLGDVLRFFGPYRARPPR